jgi:hypothetical protein
MRKGKTYLWPRNIDNVPWAFFPLLSPCPHCCCHPIVVLPHPYLHCSLLFPLFPVIPIVSCYSHCSPLACHPSSSPSHCCAPSIPPAPLYLCDSGAFIVPSFFWSLCPLHWHPSWSLSPFVIPSSLILLSPHPLAIPLSISAVIVIVIPQGVGLVPPFPCPCPSHWCGRCWLSLSIG